MAESPAKIRCQPGGEPGTSRSVTKIQNSNITSFFGNRDCHGGVQSKKKFSSSNNSHKQTTKVPSSNKKADECMQLNTISKYFDSMSEEEQVSI